MKKFLNLGKPLSKDEQIRVKGGCTPEEMCDPEDLQACGGIITCSCGQGSFNCCRNARLACVQNHGCPQAYTCAA